MSREDDEKRKEKIMKATSSGFAVFISRLRSLCHRRTEKQTAIQEDDDLPYEHRLCGVIAPGVERWTSPKRGKRGRNGDASQSRQRAENPERLQSSRAFGPLAANSSGGQGEPLP